MIRRRVSRFIATSLRTIASSEQPGEARSVRTSCKTKAGASDQLNQLVQRVELGRNLESLRQLVDREEVPATRKGGIDTQVRRKLNWSIFETEAAVVIPNAEKAGSHEGENRHQQRA